MNAWCETESAEALRSVRAAAPAAAAVTLWLAGSSVATAWATASLGGCATAAAAGAPTGLMLKFVLMAASWLLPSQIPTPLRRQLLHAPLNAMLESAMNAALQPARQFDEKCKGSDADDQSERLTASGVIWRGPGAA